MNGLLFDLRAALRSLRNAPAFALTAIATLALGIAINVAMFSLVYGLFLRPPPYPQPQQLFEVRAYQHTPSSNPLPSLPVLAATLQRFGTLAGYTFRSAVVNPLAGRGAPERLDALVTDPSLFDVLGVKPRLGRTYSEVEARANAALVVVSDWFWRTRLGGTTAALGSHIQIDGKDHTVIGVMPSDFDYPLLTRLYLPLPDPAAFTIGTNAEAVLRLREGGAQPQALAALQARLGSGVDADLRTLRQPLDVMVALMLVAIAFVLLIACSNVANLMLARGTARNQELAIRAALGGSRLYLIRYLTIEGALLAVLGVAAGTLASWWIVDILIATMPIAELPGWFNPRPDLRVLAYIALLGVITVLLSALLPAFNSTRSALAIGARVVSGRESGRLRSTLVAIQIALTIVLLACTGFMIKTLRAALAYDPGYAAQNILQIQVQRTASATRSHAFVTAAIARVGALPGVTGAAALGNSELISGQGSTFRAVRGNQRGKPTVTTQVIPEPISANALTVMGLPLLRGRTFLSNDEPNAALVSEIVARRLYGDLANALGATLQFDPDSAALRFTVVGVVADRGLPMFGGERWPMVYLPLRYSGFYDVRILARTTGNDPLRLSAAVTATLRALEPDAAVQTAQTLLLAERRRSDVTHLPWFVSLFTAFGLTALFLSTLGIYGIVAYSVSRRTREIGVRMALGATRERVMRHMIKLVFPPLFFGLAVGLLLALALANVLRSAFYGVRSADPLLLGGTLGFFLLVALVAALVPARRATRMDPLHALRAE